MFDQLARFALVRRIHRSFYTWDAEQLRQHHRQRLADILTFVIHHSPYYRRLRAEGWDGHFETLPYLSKGELLAHYDEINTAGLKQTDLVKYAIAQERGARLDLYRGRYVVGLSSGTSGTRLPTVLSPRERWQYGSLLFARSGLPERLRQPRVLFTLRVNSAAFMEVRQLGVMVVYADYTHSPEALARLINERRLNVLAGPPSLLRLLARERRLIEPAIEALVSYAEVLDDATRAQLQAAFGVPVAQIYQGTEGFIASTCRKGRLHLNEDVVYVEALETGDLSGAARRVVVTDLHRKTLPILRYQMNDILELSPFPCACGSSFRVVERIHGRADDVFYLRGNDGQTRLLFPDYVVRSINQASDDLLEFQAIQHAIDHIEIRLLLRPGADRLAAEQQIRRNLTYWAEKAGGRLGEVVFSDALPERNPNSLKLIRVTRRCA